MRFRLLGRYWSFAWVKFPHNSDSRGTCDHPEAPAKAVMVDPRQPEVEVLETIIHECLHAADWHKDEAWVETVGRDIARLLWRLGYRRK